MAMIRLLKRGLVLSVLALSACGNASDDSVVGNFVKTRLAKAGAKPAAPPQSTTLRAALQASKKPVAVLVAEGSKTPTLLEQVDRNGAYRTYFTAGGQSVTFRNGFVTATRGLGHDLMSASWGQTHMLISTKRAGSGRKVMRFLTGEGGTVALEFTCSVTLGGTEQMTSGELNINTRVMHEACTGDGYSFTNGYQVAPSGMVVSSRQWLGPISGSVAIDQLRL